MPQTPERKREYMREYMRRKHGFAPRGVAGKRDTKGDLVPPLEKREFSPLPIPMNPRTMSKAKLVAYLAHVGRRGFSLVYTSRGYELVANTGNLVPFDGVAIIEQQLGVQGQRITQLEADLARLEMMMDSVLREWSN